MAEKIRFQSLEPRVLLDAAGLLTAAETTRDSFTGDQQDQSHFEPPQVLAPTTQAEKSSESALSLMDAGSGVFSVEATALVVVDTSIENYESLLADIAEGTEVLLIDGDADGLDQILDYVAGRNDISSIHILSHGDQGQLQLGTTEISSANINDFQERLAQLGSALTADGDILLYGCNVAAGETGIDFVNKLAGLTSADIAASTNLTGASDLGGDWDLEQSVGTVESKAIVSESFDGLLFNPQPLDLSGTALQDGDGTAGTTYTYTNVGTFGGVAVDAVFTLVSVNSDLNAGPDQTADDFPTLLSFDINQVNPLSWQPNLGEPLNDDASSGGYSVSVTWDIQFVESGTTTALQIDTFMTLFDVDGDGSTANFNYGEFVSVTAPVVSVVLAGGPDGPTGPDPATVLDFDISYDGADTTILLTTDPTLSNPGIDGNEAFLAKYQIVAANSFQVTLGVTVEPGSTWNNAFTRVSSILFDDVVLTTPNTISIPILDADGDNSSGSTNNDFQNAIPYVSGGGNTPVVDTDVGISDTDPNATSMSSGSVTLTNPQPGDVLNVINANLPAGISATGNGSSTISLSGIASIADYQLAYQQIFFANNNSVVDGVDRTLELRVFNGEVLSPIATTTIDVLGTPEVDALVTSETQPTITGTWDNTTGTALSVTVDLITYTLGISPQLTQTNGVWSLDLSGVQTLAPGTFDISVSTSGGGATAPDTTTSELTILTAPEWSIVGDSNVAEGNSATYTISLVGAQVLPTGETVSIDVDLIDVETMSGDHADLDAALTTIAAGRSDLTYSGSVLTYTSPDVPAAAADIVINLAATSDATAEADEDFRIELSNAANSLTGTNDAVTTTITDEDEAPTVTATASNATFTENISSPVSIFTSTSVDTAESGQTVKGLVFTVNNLADGANEVININGSSVSLVNGSGTTSTNGYGYSVSLVGGIATVTLTTTGASELAIETLLDNLTYQNNNVDKPTPGTPRTVAVTSITDSGAGAPGATNTTTTGLPSSTVTVVDVNDAPVVTKPLVNLVAQDATPIDVHGKGFSVGDVDIGTATATATLSVTDVSANILVVAGNSGITIVSGNDSDSVVISGTILAIDSLLRGASSGSITYTGDATPVVDDVFTVSVNDNGNTGPITETDANSIDISRVSNDPPVINNLHTDVLNYTEGDTVSVLDQVGTAATITDPDGGNFDGGRLVVTTSGNVTSEDRFSIGNVGLITYNSGTGDVSYNGTVIGNAFSSFSSTAGGFISLNANADETAATALLQAISYTNINTADPSEVVRTVGFSFEDGDGGTSAGPITVTINVTAVDDPPTVDLDGPGGGTGFSVLHSGTPVSITDTDVAVTEDEDDPVTLKIVHSAISDGALETLDFDGTSFPLNASSTQTGITVGGVVVDVVYTLGTSTFDITANSGTLSQTDAQLILAAIQYDNTDPTPTFGDRTFSVTANDGTSDSNIAVSTVTVNAPPTVDLDGDGVDTGFTNVFGIGGPAVNITDTDALVGDADADLVTISIVKGGILDGVAEVLVIGSTDFTLDGTAQSAGDITVGGILIDVLYDGTTFTITSDDSLTGVTVAAAALILEDIRYRNDSGSVSFGDRTFSVTTFDGQAISNVAVATISINRPPVVSNQNNLTYTENGGAVVIDSALTITDVDDTDIESASISITGGFVSSEDLLAFVNANGITGSYNSATGVLTLTGTATLAEYEAALESITYENTSESPDLADRTITWLVNDGGADSAPVISTVFITQVNDPAVFGGDTSGSGVEDAGDITGNLTVTDAADGITTPNFTVTSAAGNGVASINAMTGDWTYTPAADFNGTDSFTVSVTDDDGNIETQVITLTVTVDPDVVADAVTTAEDTAVTDNVATNDNFEGATTYTVNNDAANGTVMDNGSGGYTYTPNANFNGTDTFTYQVDNAGVTETSTVTVMVTPVTDFVEVSLAGPTSVVEGDTTTAYTVTLGEAVPVGNSVTVNLAYTGTATDGTDFTGVASVVVTGGNTSTTFTLATLDDVLAENAETIIIDIDSIDDTNSSFEAMVEGTNNQVTTLIVELTANTPPVNTVPGAQTVEEDSALLFTGANAISVTDAEGLASTQLTVVSGTLNLTLSGAATISAGEIASSTLTISGSQADINDTLATLSYQGLENFVGVDTLTVLSTDSGGIPLTDLDSVSINVIQSNDPAIFGGDISGSGEEDGGAITGTLTVTDPADGVTSPRFAMMNVASNGTVSIDASTGVWTYTPNADFNGADNFLVSITDDDGNVETQVISLNVTPEQDAFDDAVTTKAGLAVTGIVLSNDQFEDVPVYTINSDASSGTVVDNGGGQFTYTPAENFDGTDSFSYEVTSGGVAETAIVTVTVTPQGGGGDEPLVPQETARPNPTPVSVPVVGSNSTPSPTSNSIVNDSPRVDVVRAFGNSSENIKINPILLRGQLADQVVQQGTKEFVISDGEFEHSLSGSKLSYEALLANGDPLPDYIRFDESTGTFSFDADIAKLEGIENVEIRVVARDSSGNRVSTSFEVEFGEAESADSSSGSRDSDTLVETDSSVASEIDGELLVEEAGSSESESDPTSGDLSETKADGSEASAATSDTFGVEGQPTLEQQDALPIRLAVDLVDQYAQDVLRYSIAGTFISTLGDNLQLIAQMEDGSDLPEYIVFDEASEEFIIDGELAKKLGVESVIIQVVATDSDGNSTRDSFLVKFEPEIVQDAAAVQGKVEPVASSTEVPGVSYQITSLDAADFEQVFAGLLEAMSTDGEVDETEEKNQTKEDLNSQIARAGEFGYQQDKLELSELLQKIFS